MFDPYNIEELETIRQYPKLQTEVGRWLATVDTLMVKLSDANDTILDMVEEASWAGDSNHLGYTRPE